MSRLRRRIAKPALAVGACFAVVMGLLAQAPAGALPQNAPKVGMVCTTGPTFDLWTGTGDIQTPDGNTVFMWSYADHNDFNPQLRAFQYPGPNLCVNQGDTVVIHLHNTLPEPSSIIFPGQDTPIAASGGAPGLLTTEAAGNGGDVTYTFTANRPGTYLYESGTNIEKQVEMGMYGALIVRPTGHADWAYNAATAFNPSEEYILLLAEIDPVLHQAVKLNKPFDFTTKHDRYFTVNGRSFPDTIQENGSALLPFQPYGAMVRMRPTVPGEAPSLIRMLNAGSDNHPFHPHGNHATQISQDGRLVTPTEHFGETIGAGMTEDFTLRWDNAVNGDNWNPTTNPLPADQPNYRELTFKDGNTWYSGSPYLGFKGPFPTGTVSQNICGEWYFPFHSHALNEFSNFDEGFGGMGTLLRIDPRDGCSVTPSTVKVLTGTANGGSATSLAQIDGGTYRVNSTTSGGQPRTSAWYAQFDGVAAGATNLQVAYTGSAYSATNNFNTLASGGNTATGGLNGWTFTETGGTGLTSYGISNGTSTAGNTYSYGSTGSSDRAFGTLLNSPKTALRIGTSFTNNTGATISQLEISYTGEQWRYGGAVGADRLDFQFCLGSTNSVCSTTGSGWTDVDLLDFNSPVTSGSAGALNGNATANRTAVHYTIGGLSIPNNATYRIRFNDADKTGADDGLAIDDFSILASPPATATFAVWNWTNSTWVVFPTVPSPAIFGTVDGTVTGGLGSPTPYIGTGTHKGSVRVRVLTTHNGNFTTAGNAMSLVYTAP